MRRWTKAAAAQEVEGKREGQMKEGRPEKAKGPAINDIQYVGGGGQREDVRKGCCVGLAA